MVYIYNSDDLFLSYIGQYNIIWVTSDLQWHDFNLTFKLQRKTISPIAMGGFRRGASRKDHLKSLTCAYIFLIEICSKYQFRHFIGYTQIRTNYDHR